MISTVPTVIISSFLVGIFMHIQLFFSVKTFHTQFTSELCTMYILISQVDLLQKTSAKNFRGKVVGIFFYRKFGFHFLNSVNVQVRHHLFVNNSNMFKVPGCIFSNVWSWILCLHTEFAHPTFLEWIDIKYSLMEMF